MNLPILENQIRRQYRLFAHEGYWSQLHAQDPKENKLVSRELVKGEEAVIRWARAFNGKGNLYLGRAARDSNGIPIRTSVFTLDVDPCRAKGTASSPEQHSKALRTGRAIVAGLGGGYLCTSGNGALVIFPFDRPITEGLLEFSEKAKQFEAQLRDVYQTSEVTIDATQDAARLCRLLGTWNVKGTREQWRPARIVSQPVLRAKRFRVRETIEAFAGGIGAQVYGGKDTNWKESGMEIKLPEASAGLPTYDHSLYPTREKAEFALALRLKLAGFGPDDIREQLGRIGYMRNPRDAERVVAKLFANDGRGATAVQRGVQLGGQLYAPTPEPLWTPASGIGQGSVHSESDSAKVGTGFKFLDAKLGGFRPGYVYAIEAPTNVGKSTCITQIANHLARCGRRVLLVITEMDVREAITRIKGIDSGIPTSCIESERLTADQRSALRGFEDRFAKYKLFIRYTTSPNQSAIERDIQDSKAEVVLWDYFQHFETGTESRQVQLGSLARWFESTALKYQIPFIVAAQLHRRVDFKTNKVLPSTMDQIKDCKVLNDAAKVVVTLDWQHGEHGEDEPVPVVMDIQKNKGPMAKGVVRLVREIPRFEDL